MKTKRLLAVILCVIATCAFAIGMAGCIHVHTFENQWTCDSTHHWKEATCSDNVVGYKEKHVWDENFKCTVCSYKSEHIVATDEAVAPTCTETGLTEGQHCTQCGEVLTPQEVIPALGHDEVIDAAVDATCTETGLTEGKHCARCGEVLIEQTLLSATGHSHVGVITAPTCVDKGYTTYTCHCGDSYVDDYVDALGHTAATAVEENKVEATCTTNGSYDLVVYCSVCNAEISREAKTIKAKGHSYNAVVTAPTCVDKGYTTYTCHCGDSYVDNYVDALGHTVVIDAAVDATCTKTGLTEGKHCSVCGEVLVAQEEVDALGHTEVIDAAKAPTCTATGLTEGKHCSVCGEVLVKQEIVAALGHTVVIDAAVAPICTATGLTEGSHCSVCGEVIVAQEEVDALGHTEVTDEAVEPTCTKTGLTEGSHCSVCKEVLVEQEEVDALGHTEVVDAAVEPTCTETGLTEGKHCSVCGEVLIAQTEVSALGHTEVVDAAVEPICTTTGLTEGKHCSVCKEVLVKQEIVEAKGHDIENHDAKAPTCTEIGWDAYETCSRCDYTTYKVINATGHTIITVNAIEPTCTEGGHKAYEYCSKCDYTTYEEIMATGHDYKSVVTDPTCTEDGYTTHTCLNCGDIYTDSETNALGHTESEWIVDTPATCTAEGSKHKECSVCHETLITEVIEKIAHTDEIIPGKAATCTESGLTEGKKCSVCGEVLTAQEVVDALGHTEVIDAAKAPTCTATGLTEGKHCSVCGEVLVKREVVEKLAHTEEIIPGKAATCTESGLTEGKKCSVCGEVLVAQEVVDALGHSYTNEINSVIISEYAVANEWKNAHKYEEVNISSNVTLTIAEGGSNSGKYYNGEHMRIYQSENPQIIISSIKEILSVKITYSVSNNGILLLNTNQVETNDVVNVNASTIIFTIGNTGSAINGQVRISAIEVILKGSPIGFTEEEIETVAPTCTETGLTAGIKCAHCGEILLAQEIIPATGHTSSDWIVDKNATCTEDGSKHKECSVCHETLETEKISAAHTPEVIVATPATCTQPGMSGGTMCSICGEALEEPEIIPAMGHSYGDDAKCSVCGEEQPEISISKFNAIASALEDKTATEEKYLVSGVITKVTNTEYGNMYIKDDNGDELYIYGFYSNDGSIRYDAMEVKPIVGDEVVVYGVAKNYNGPQMENAWLFKHTAHEHNEETVISAVAATCTKTGLTEGTKCSICGKITKEQTEIPTLSHNYVNGVCTVCNEKESELGDSITTDILLSEYYTNADKPNETLTKDKVMITFSKNNGSTAPTYYDSGTAVRLYAKGSVSIKVEEGYVIESITITFGSGDGSNALTVDSGTLNEGEWTGNANSVVITVGGTSGHRRIASIKVVYKAA